jgi:peroxiredoxin
VRLVAISVDPPATSKKLKQEKGYGGFTFLADPQAEVIRRYDVLHAGGGEKGEEIARPAEFVIDSSGIVRWVNLTESILVRARPGEVLAAVDAMGAVAHAR